MRCAHQVDKHVDKMCERTRMYVLNCGFVIHSVWIQKRFASVFVRGRDVDMSIKSQCGDINPQEPLC